MSDTDDGGAVARRRGDLVYILPGLAVASPRASMLGDGWAGIPPLGDYDADGRTSYEMASRATMLPMRYLLPFLVMCGCRAPESETDETDAPVGDSDTDATSCPLQEGNAVTGGRYTIASSTYYGTGSDWPLKPDGPGGVACITVDPAKVQFTLTWESGGFVAWHEPRIEFTEAPSVTCTYSGFSTFTCNGTSSSTSVEGIEGAPLTVGQSWGIDGNMYTSATTLSAQFGVGVGCSDWGCPQAAEELDMPLPADFRASFSAVLAE